MQAEYILNCIFNQHSTLTQLGTAQASPSGRTSLCSEATQRLVPWQGRGVLGWWAHDHSIEHLLGRAAVHAAVDGGLVELLLYRRARSELCELARGGRQRRAGNLAVLPDTYSGIGKCGEVQSGAEGVCRGAEVEGC